MRSRSETTRHARALSGARAEADDRVGSRVDVVGSMVGVKLRGGQAIDQIGLTFFVRDKLPDSELPPRQRIPKRLRTTSMSITTDVLVWPRMIEQATPTGTIISDGRLQGTLACFGISQDTVFGLSCAHCLTGVDGNPATPTMVEVFERQRGRFIPVGESVYLAYSPGPGLPGNFGYLDCGLFDLRASALVARGAAAKELSVVADVRTLLQRPLFGLSALNAPGAPNAVRRAVAIGVEAQALGEKCDLVLQVDAPGTFRGDSGMLWLTEDGRAAAMHARGEEAPNLVGSRLTTAMSAQRICRGLDVRLSLG